MYKVSLDRYWFSHSVLVKISREGRKFYWANQMIVIHYNISAIKILIMCFSKIQKSLLDRRHQRIQISGRGLVWHRQSSWNICLFPWDPQPPLQSCSGHVTILDQWVLYGCVCVTLAEPFSNSAPSPTLLCPAMATVESMCSIWYIFRLEEDRLFYLYQIWLSCPMATNLYLSP